jgi:hypothetical protein
MYIIDRALPQRSRLQFIFPNESIESRNTAKRYGYVASLPFFENISLAETKKARYQKYSLISRSSNLYSYLGSDSRQLNLSFHMTLPHILETHNGITKDRFENDISKIYANEKDLFLKKTEATPQTNSISTALAKHYLLNLAKDSAQQVLNNPNMMKALSLSLLLDLRARYGINDQSDIDIRNKIKASGGSPGSAFFGKNSLISKQLGKTAADAKDAHFTRASNQNLLADENRYKIIDIIVYWTNIIRSCVINNAHNPLLGPPIIRLSHGVMYQDIPCLCMSYNIEAVDEAGYDLQTLLPRRIKFTLDLEEIRAGDFGEFLPKDKANPVKRDNLAGWEAVVTGEFRSMDPGTHILDPGFSYTL